MEQTQKRARKVINKMCCYKQDASALKLKVLRKLKRTDQQELVFKVLADRVGHHCGRHLALRGEGGVQLPGGEPLGDRSGHLAGLDNTIRRLKANWIA
eukprot:scaffold290430_cov35-Prasinocladus_malaysianus.AAC.1